MIQLVLQLLPVLHTGKCRGARLEAPAVTQARDECGLAGGGGRAENRSGWASETELTKSPMLWCDSQGGDMRLSDFWVSGLSSRVSGMHLLPWGRW